MSRGIIDLIQENKRLFYAGKIRNRFYEQGEQQKKTMPIISIQSTEQPPERHNFKSFWQKMNESLFYEPTWTNVLSLK